MIAGIGHRILMTTLKIEEVDILYKEAGQNTIKIVDTITNDELRLINSPVFNI